MVDKTCKATGLILGAGYLVIRALDNLDESIKLEEKLKNIFNFSKNDEFDETETKSTFKKLYEGGMALFYGETEKDSEKESKGIKEIISNISVPVVSFAAGFLAALKV